MNSLFRRFCGRHYTFCQFLKKCFHAFVVPVRFCYSTENEPNRMCLFKISILQMQKIALMPTLIKSL